MDLKATIRSIPNWPKEKIIFRDITTLLENADAFREACDRFYEHYRNVKIDKIAGIEARGFLFAAVLAYRLGKGVVLIRKKGKLPFKTISESYSLEYGESTLEVHEDSINAGENILIVDDLLATGGTVKASANLVEKLGGIVAGCAFVIDLPDLGGKEVLKKYDVFTLVSFEGH